MKIWIDADAAPRDVKELVFRAAKRMQVETVLVANQRLQTPAGNPHVSAVWVDGGPDVADQHIVDHAERGDLVVTQDIPLAALLVPEGVVVLDPRGEEHTMETIGERLSIRDFMEQARTAGIVTGGPPPFDARAKQAFASALDRALTRMVRRT
ncbi:MAG: YaiI/YqxD family protein [Gemmatimonadales bacterium]|nr:MAG: YaiI/YqxD family protein [Gemmatimonadales bacterium]